MIPIPSFNAVMRALLAASAMFVLAACQTTGGAPATRLTAEEVRSTFIGRPWTQGSGTFMFGNDGNYSYADSRTNVAGTYQIAADGTVCTVNTGGANPGVRTCYTFYREGNGYKYWHDRSNQFWPASPR